MIWVEIEGLVLPSMSINSPAWPAPISIEAPLSGERCVMYRVDVSLWSRLSDPGSRRQEVSAVPFRIAPAHREQHALAVDCRHAQLIGRARKWRLRRAPGQASAQRQLLQRLQRNKATLLERRIAVGDRIVVRGWVTEYPDARGAARGYRSVPHTTVLVAHTIAPYRRSAD
jgi:hypothetical protein